MFKHVKIAKKVWVLAVAGIMISLSVQCKGSPDKSIAGIFTMITGNVTVNGQPARVGMKVGEKDIIFVEKDSSGTLQFGDKALLTIQPSTKIKVSGLVKSENGETKIHLAQYSGSTFNHVLKDKKVGYMIATPTLTAGVRGTFFSVGFDESRVSRIRLLDGSVAVKKMEPASEGQNLVVDEKKAFAAMDAGAEGQSPATAGNVVVLAAGEKIALDQKSAGQAEKLNAADTRLLETMKKVPMASGEQLRKMEEGKADATPLAVDESVKKILILPNEKAEEMMAADLAKETPKTMTMEELQQKYGRLSKVITKDGKEYVGSFRQGSNGVEVITTTGVVTIPASSISKVSPSK